MCTESLISSFTPKSSTSFTKWKLVEGGQNPSSFYHYVFPLLVALIFVHICLVHVIELYWGHMSFPTLPQPASYYFWLGRLEVMNELGDQSKKLLGILICRFPEFLLEESNTENVEQPGQRAFCHTEENILVRKYFRSYSFLHKRKVTLCLL